MPAATLVSIHSPRTGNWDIEQRRRWGERQRQRWRQRRRVQAGDRETGDWVLFNLWPHPASSLSSLNECTVMEKREKQNTGMEERKNGRKESVFEPIHSEETGPLISPTDKKTRARERGEDFSKPKRMSGIKLTSFSWQNFRSSLSCPVSDSDNISPA